MFQNLAEKLEAAFKRLRDHGKVTERDLDESLREVRMALLEADVNFRVVKEFVAGVREKALGAKVTESLTPAQQVIAVVREELASLLGGTRHGLARAAVPPTRILMVGLQGSGKTTTCVKLALHMKEAGGRPCLVPADVSRPAAVEQLLLGAGKAGVEAYRPVLPANPLEVYRNGAVWAARAGADTVIVDTAGRLHADEPMMDEIAALAAAVDPHETLLVVDAMTGQDAVHVATAFAARLALTGIVLTKLDGDARGGAALSMRHVTGLPIKFAGVGEGFDGLEPFHPDRVAARILGMGDVLTLIDKAGKALAGRTAQEAAGRQARGEFTLEDFREQLRQVRGMGTMADLLAMLPLPARFKKAAAGEVDERELVRIGAIVDSMTIEERRNPRILNGSRRRRISAGSGTKVSDVNRLIKQFEAAKKAIGLFGKGKFPRGKFPL